VTKKEIVKLISEKYDHPQTSVKDIVQETFNLIVAALVKEGRIELRNFGVFEVKRRKKRRARNPRTNEPVEVEAKNVVTFQPGKFMEEEVRHAEKVVNTKKKPTKSPRSQSTKFNHPSSHSSRIPDLEEEPVTVGVGGNTITEDQLQSSDLPHKPR
jgi:nucleoid DNA-binding protein